MRRTKRREHHAREKIIRRRGSSTPDARLRRPRVDVTESTHLSRRDVVSVTKRGRWPPSLDHRVRRTGAPIVRRRSFDSMTRLVFAPIYTSYTSEARVRCGRAPRQRALGTIDLSGFLQTVLRDGATIRTQLELRRILTHVLSSGVDRHDVLIVRWSILHVGHGPRDELRLSEGQRRQRGPSSPSRRATN